MECVKSITLAISKHSPDTYLNFDTRQANGVLIKINALQVLAHFLFSAALEFLNLEYAVDQNGLRYTMFSLNIVSFGLSLGFLALSKRWLKGDKEVITKLAFAKLIHLLIFIVLTILIFVARNRRVQSAENDFPASLIIGGFILLSYLITYFFISNILWVISISLCIVFNGLWTFLHSDSQDEIPSQPRLRTLAIAYSVCYTALLFGTLYCISLKKKIGTNSLKIFENLIKNLHLGVILLDENNKMIYGNHKMFKIFCIQDDSLIDLQMKLDSLLFETYKKVDYNTYTSSKSWGSKRQGPSYLQENTVSFKSLFQMGEKKKYYTSVSEEPSKKRSFEELFDESNGFRSLGEGQVLLPSLTEMKDCSKIKSFKVKVKKLFSELPYRMVTFLDVTEAKIISEINNNKIYKENLLKSFSHELKTPLNNAQSILQCAMRDSEISPELKEKYLRHPINSIHLLSLLIHDIVDFLKLEANQLRLDIQEFSPRSLLKEVFDLVEMKAKEKGVKIELRIEHDLPSYLVRTDRERLLRILTNFTLNCIKYTFHGIVRISADSQRLNTESEDYKFIINISDTRTFRSSNTVGEGKRARAMSGTQEEICELGLLINKYLISTLLPESDSYKCFTTEIGIVHRIAIPYATKNVQSSGPRLSLRRSISKTHFSNNCINSPEKNIQSEPEHATPLINKPCTCDISLLGLRKKVIEKYVLIVDDEAFNLLSLEMILIREGLLVLKALNGKDAVELVQNFEKFNNMGDERLIVLALLDLNMPVMDGFECTKFLLELFKEGEISSFPVYACSANDSAEYQEKCKEVGMDGFIAKPLTAKNLHHILQSLQSK